VPAKSDPFAALADRTRRAILDLLREEETMTAGEIAARFPHISRAAVSKHLGVLRRARLVRAHERGRERDYRLDPGPLDEIYREWLSRFVPEMEESLRRLKRQAEGPSARRGR
jgi:DNA-binding transcriptional ArsR family regulator